MKNTLCNGIIKNNNPKSPIAYFQLFTVREYNDYEGGTYLEEIKTVEDFLNNDWDSIDQPFYRIFGQRYIEDVLTTPIFLGDFYSLDKAKEFLYYLTGEYPEIISY